MRLAEWAFDKVHVPIPRWVVGFFDPAQAYMERSTRRPPGGSRHRPARRVASYGPLTADGGLPRESEEWAPPVPPPEAKEWLRWLAHESAVRRGEILGSLAPALDGAVKELQEQGTTVIAIPPVALSARIVAFRWGDAVLEVDGRRGSGVGGTSGSRARIGRQKGEKQAEILKCYLADALADLAAGS